MELPKIVRELPQAPKDIANWIRREVAQETYLIYNKKKRRVVCTRCGAVYDIDDFEEEVKHNEKSICWNCERTATFKASGIGRKNIEEQTRVLVFVRKGKSVYASLTEIDISFETEIPEIRKWLSAVYKFNDKEQIYAKHRPGWCFGYEHWEYPKNIRVPAMPSGNWMYGPKREGLHVYTKNFDKVFENSDLKYADVRDFFDTGELSGEELIRYLDLHLKYTSIELLRKSGFESLVLQKIGEGRGSGVVYWRGKDLRKILRLDMGHIRKIREYDFRFMELKTYREYLKKGVELTEDEIELVNGTYGITKEDINKITPFEKAVRYIASQNKLHHNYSRMSDYEDFLRDCERLGLDTRTKRIIYPKNFEQTHQRFARMAQTKADKELDEKIKNIGLKMEFQVEKYETENLVIMPAGSAEELKIEGSRLGHCVGGYAESMARGSCIIYFIREKDKPDQSYYTLELSPKGEVRQCRGKRNCSMTDEVREFVDKWKKQIIKKKKKSKKVKAD